MWKPLIYRGVDYGEFYEIEETGRIKRNSHIRIAPFGVIDCPEVIHKPIKSFSMAVAYKDLRKTIDVKRAVAENFIETIGGDYLYVHKYDIKKDNRASNLYWSNQKSITRESSSYNVIRERNVELDRELVKAYEVGMTYDEMYQRFNVSRYYIRKALDLYGVVRKQERNRANTSIDLKLVHDLFSKGYSLRQVADELNISKFLASYYKKVVGLRKTLKIVSSQK